MTCIMRQSRLLFDARRIFVDSLEVIATAVATAVVFIYNIAKDAAIKKVASVLVNLIKGNNKTPGLFARIKEGLGKIFNRAKQTGEVDVAKCAQAAQKTASDAMKAAAEAVEQKIELGKRKGLSTSALYEMLNNPMLNPMAHGSIGYKLNYDHARKAMRDSKQKRSVKRPANRATAWEVRRTTGIPDGVPIPSDYVSSVNPRGDVTVWQGTKRWFKSSEDLDRLAALGKKGEEVTNAVGSLLSGAKTLISTAAANDNIEAVTAGKLGNALGILEKAIAAGATAMAIFEGVKKSKSSAEQTIRIVKNTVTPAISALRKAASMIRQRVNSASTVRMAA